MIAFKATQRDVIAFRHHKDKRGRLTTDRWKAGVVLLDDLDLANRHIEPDGVMLHLSFDVAIRCESQLIWIG